jgi:hypothetical protein
VFNGYYILPREKKLLALRNFLFSLNLDHDRTLPMPRMGLRIWKEAQLLKHECETEKGRHSRGRGESGGNFSGWFSCAGLQLQQRGGGEEPRTTPQSTDGGPRPLSGGGYRRHQRPTLRKGQ